MGKVEKAPQTSSERAATGSNDLDARRVGQDAASLNRKVDFARAAQPKSQLDVDLIETVPFNAAEHRQRDLQRRPSDGLKSGGGYDTPAVAVCRKQTRGAGRYPAEKVKSIPEWVCTVKGTSPAAVPAGISKLS